jgi:hypothetical protein
MVSGASLKSQTYPDPGSGKNLSQIWIPHPGGKMHRIPDQDSKHLQNPSFEF